MTPVPDPKSNSWMDATAIGLSGLCLAHCLLLPFAVAALPVLGQVAGDHLVHQVLILLAAPLSVWALHRTGGWKKPLVAALAVFGLGLLAAAAFVPVVAAHETLISIIGAMFVAGAHYLNSRLHRRGHKHA
ncbi:MerC domain-containing protein [Asticcacaulis sp.]|uniref:MerC domain-containing protein n=1 Tax=Asticcacaulis sp. TaxID=1872648 RepID=UPI0026144764|nr:MerC domain-containing protein [Asticcacaulis sp.]